MLEDIFDRREIVVMSMAINHYVNSSDCPEPEGVRAELRECVRKLDLLITCDPTDDTPYPFPRIPEVEEWEKQRKKETVNPLYSLPLEETDGVKEDSDLFK